MTFFHKVFFLVLCFVFVQCKQNQPIEKKVEPTEKTQKKKSKKRKKRKKRRKKKQKVESEQKEFPVEVSKETPNEKQEKILPKEVTKAVVTKKAKAVKTVKKKVIPKKKGEVAFFKMKHNYGRIEMGEKVEYEFKFVNKGKEPVSIENVDVSCGCTTPVFPFVPIKPGKMGSVKVLFDSENRLGPQESLITVYTDGETPEFELALVGEIITDIAQPFDSLSRKKDKK